MLANQRGLLRSFLIVEVAGSIDGNLNELQANKFDAFFGFGAFSLKVNSDGFFDAFCQFVKSFGLGVTARQIGY